MGKYYDAYRDRREAAMLIEGYIADLQKEFCNPDFHPTYKANYVREVGGILIELAATYKEANDHYLDLNAEAAQADKAKMAA